MITNGYTIRCFKCSSDHELQMVAHRNDQRQMVGWIFICKGCFSFVKGKNLEIFIKEENGTEE